MSDPKKKKNNSKALPAYPDLEEVSLELIIRGGNARNEAYQALKAARAGLFEEAEAHLEKAEKEIEGGHQVQTSLLQSGEEGAKTKADLLFVHAHGHLMNAMTEKALIAEMVELYKKLQRDYLHFG